MCVHAVRILQDVKDEQKRKEQLQRDKKLKSLHNLKSDAEKRTRQFEQKVCSVHLLVWFPYYMQVQCHHINDCMYVCMYVSIFICTYIYTYIRMYVRMQYARTYVRI